MHSLPLLQEPCDTVHNCEDAVVIGAAYQATKGWVAWLLSLFGRLQAEGT